MPLIVLHQLSNLITHHLEMFLQVPVGFQSRLHGIPLSHLHVLEGNQWPHVSWKVTKCIISLACNLPDATDLSEATVCHEHQKEVGASDN